MYESRDDLVFCQKRAEQLFDEGCVAEALQLVRMIGDAQACIFDETVNLLALDRAEC